VFLQRPVWWIVPAVMSIAGINRRTTWCWTDAAAWIYSLAMIGFVTLTTFPPMSFDVLVDSSAGARDMTPAMAVQAARTPYSAGREAVYSSFSA
jgi:hypothetical protein